DLDRPQLKLDENFIKIINDTCSTIHLHIKDKELKPCFDDQEHPIETALKASETNKLESTLITDITQIQETLLLISDIIRIALLLNIDKINNLTILPRLEVPMINLLSKSSTSCGNLIIVDTPGPNEDQLSKHLKQVIINELRKSAIILIALDFNSLNSTAEVELKRNVETVRSSRWSYSIQDDNDYLYAVVNKIDQRDEIGDSTTEQIKAFISSRFNIQRQNIFEVSAKNALLSFIFFRNMQVNKAFLADTIFI
ncbi:unnamed protein product, partial [Didymodactylos carnosus]